MRVDRSPGIGGVEGFERDGERGLWSPLLERSERESDSACGACHRSTARKRANAISGCFFGVSPERPERIGIAQRSLHS